MAAPTTNQPDPATHCLFTVVAGLGRGCGALGEARPIIIRMMMALPPSSLTKTTRLLALPPSSMSPLSLPSLFPPSRNSSMMIRQQQHHRRLVQQHLSSLSSSPSPLLAEEDRLGLSPLRSSRILRRPRASIASSSSSSSASSSVAAAPVVVRSGGCACGSIRYLLRDDPMIVHACFCEDCQRLSGSAFVTNAWTEASNLEFVREYGAFAETEASSLVGGSGRSHSVCFCKKCSTSIYSRYGGAPGSIFVRVGTLDDPSEFPPNVCIWTRSKPTWFDVNNSFTDKEIPVYPEYYKMRDVWNPKNVERFKALMSSKANKGKEEHPAS